MGKSKKKSPISTFVGLFGAILGIVAIFMGFMKFVTLTGKLLGKESEVGSLTGFVGVFGATAGEETPAWSILADGVKDGKAYINFKVGILILFILLAVGVLLVLLGSFMKGKFGKFIVSVGGLCLIAGGVMAFFSIQLCSFKSAGDATLGYTYSLGIGAILTGVIGTVGGLLSAGAGVSALFK